MTLKTLVLFASVLVAALMSPAAAHRVTWSDPDQADAPEREMEIRSVTQRHSRHAFEDTAGRARLLIFDIRTYEDFENNRLEYWETEHWALLIAFNLDDRPDLDRIVYVDAERDAIGQDVLYGVVTGGPQRHDPTSEGIWVPMRRVLGYARVERPAPDVVRVSFPAKTLLRDGVDDFEWRVRTVWCEHEGSDEECTSASADYAPDDRMRQGHSRAPAPGHSTAWRAALTCPSGSRS